MRKKFTILYAIFFSILFTGCPKGPAPVAFEVLQIGKGSVFVFLDTPYDTNGGILLDSAFISKDSVLETHLSLFGKTNVMDILYIDQRHDTTFHKYFNYEPNGDFSIYLPPPFRKWISLPIKNWRPEVTTLLDSTFSNKRVIIKDSIFVSIINEKDYSSPYIPNPFIGVDEVDSTFEINNGITNKSFARIEWLFSPNIGYFISVKPFFTTSILLDSYKLGRSLKSYTLR